MMRNGWLILSILFVASILSITAIVDRYLALRRSRLNANRFVDEITRILRTR